MNLELTPDEAKALHLGFSWGQISRVQITDIADYLIVNANGLPSSEICELAVCGSDFKVEEALSKFFQDAEKWKPLVLLLTKYLPLTELDESERVSLYYSVSNYVDWEDAEPWLTFKVRCHELSDARVGTWGDVAEISSELFDIFQPPQLIQNLFAQDKLCAARRDGKLVPRTNLRIKLS